MGNCRVGVAVVVRRGDYVLLGRRKNVPSDGLWACPGGSVERESATAGVRRELEEETGLSYPYNLRPLKTWLDEDLDVKYGDPYVCVFFECDAPEDWQPINLEPEKCYGWEWFKIYDLPDEMMPGSRQAIMESSALDSGYWGG